MAVFRWNMSALQKGVHSENFYLSEQRTAGKPFRSMSKGELDGGSTKHLA